MTFLSRFLPSGSTTQNSYQSDLPSNSRTDPDPTNTDRKTAIQSWINNSAIPASSKVNTTGNDPGNWMYTSSDQPTLASLDSYADNSYSLEDSKRDLLKAYMERQAVGTTGAFTDAESKEMGRLFKVYHDEVEEYRKQIISTGTTCTEFEPTESSQQPGWFSKFRGDLTTSICASFIINMSVRAFGLESCISTYLPWSQSGGNVLPDWFPFASSVIGTVGSYAYSHASDMLLKGDDGGTESSG